MMKTATIDIQELIKFHCKIMDENRNMIRSTFLFNCAILQLTFLSILDNTIIKIFNLFINHIDMDTMCIHVTCTD